MAITLKLSISDPMLVKSKCVWEAVVFLKNCKQTAEIFFENWKKLPPLKHILALPTWGQKCLISELWPFEIKYFELGHPGAALKTARYRTWLHVTSYSYTLPARWIFRPHVKVLAHQWPSKPFLGLNNIKNSAFSYYISLICNLLRYVRLI